MNNHNNHFSAINDQHFWNSDRSIHKDLIATKELIYDPCKMIISKPESESESAEYGAYTFKLNSFDIRFRVAKITPTKTGQFVALWKRSAGGPIQPFDASDPVDFFVICVRHHNHFGQFVFPKSVLCEKDIFSVNSKGGKRGIRVYPSWDETNSKQAKKTKEWQMKYFLELQKNSPLNNNRVKALYSNC